MEASIVVFFLFFFNAPLNIIKTEFSFTLNKDERCRIFSNLIRINSNNLQQAIWYNKGFLPFVPERKRYSVHSNLTRKLIQFIKTTEQV